MRRFRVDRIDPPGAWMAPSAEVAHHLHVLRIRPGERVILFDGAGQEAVAVLLDASPPRLEVLEPIASRLPRWPVHLIIGLPKGPAMDLAVRMATEAGVTDIHPVLTERSVPRGDRLDRWERIAESAAEQCGRGDIPTLHELLPYASALDALPTGLDLRIAVPGAAPHPSPDGPCGVMIGPEGGFTESEVLYATERGIVGMSLGPFILRTDTAAAVAVASIAGR